MVSTAKRHQIFKMSRFLYCHIYSAFHNLCTVYMCELKLGNHVSMWFLNNLLCCIVKIRSKGDWKNQADARSVMFSLKCEWLLSKYYTDMHLLSCMQFKVPWRKIELKHIICFIETGLNEGCIFQISHGYIQGFIIFHFKGLLKCSVHAKLKIGPNIFLLKCKQWLHF